MRLDCLDDVPKADRLPAVKWRQQNLARLTRNKRIALLAQLEAVLGQPATPSQFTLFSGNQLAPGRVKAEARQPLTDHRKNVP